MKVDKAHMREAAPHIERAHRSLEMLSHFVINKEDLSLAKRVPRYYEILIDSVLELQKLLLTDSEYTEKMTFTLSTVNGDKSYNYNVQQGKDGKTYYSLNAIMPLTAMKQDVVFSGRIRYE